jgi:DNA recombination protein RmuC
VLRPDLVVRLPEEKCVVVDSKVSLQAVLDAMGASDEQARCKHMRNHARQLRTHVDQLASKEYWKALETTPEFVVLFVPGESFLALALEQDPSLLEAAMSRRVILATPTTLMALLHTVAFTWHQSHVSASAQEIASLGRELYERLGTLGDRVSSLGRRLSKAVESYNQMTNTLEGRVLVSARRLQKQAGLSGPELPEPTGLEAAPRVLTAPELQEGAEEEKGLAA